MNYLFIKNKKNYRILLYKDFLNTNLSMYLEQPYKLFNYSVQVYKNSKRTRASSIIIDNQLYFFKSYNRRGLFHTFKSIVRKSRAFNALDTAIKLADLHINTPLIIAAIEKRHINMVIESYCLTEFIDGIKIQNLLTKKDFNYLTNILTLLSHFIANIHNRNIFHGDLKANNLLIDKRDQSKLWLLDLDSVKFKNKISLKERAKDIARFIVSINNLVSQDSILFFINNYIKKTDVLMKKELFIETVNIEISKIQKRHEKKAKLKR